MADTVAPTLTSLILPDLGTDRTGGYSFTTFRAGARDDSSGVARVTLTLDRGYTTSSGGSSSVIDFSGGDLSLPFSFSVAAGTSAGTYHVLQAVVVDGAGNVATYSGDQLTALGIQNQFTIATSTTPDVLRPYLDELSIPANIATSPAGTPVTFGINAYDAGIYGSGIAQAVVRFDRALQTTSGAVDALTFVPADANTGAFMTTLAVTSATPGGAYNVTGVTITDKAGNTVSYGAADLALLSGNKHFIVDDRTAPVLTSLSTGTADVRNGTAGAPVSVSATDAAGNISEVDLTLDRAVAIPYFVAHSTRSVYTTNVLVALPSQGGFYTQTLDPNTRPGTYTITQAVARDMAGNSTTYTTADLVRLGFSSSFTVIADADAPTLTALSLPAQPIAATSTLYSTASFGFAGTDTGSTVFNTVDATLQFNRPLGTVFQPTSLSVSSTRGQAGSGTIATTGAAPGLYVLSTATLKDYVGNQRVYGAADVAALGFNTAFVIAQTVQASGFVAAADGFFSFAGGSGYDQVTLNGNVGDYTLSRAASPAAGTQFDGNGLYVLTARDGGSIYYFDQAVETIRFQNRQYLSLKDLSAYVAAGIAPTATIKDSAHAYQQAPGGILTFIGDAATNTAVLNGNVGDYTIRRFGGEIATDGTRLNGIELFATNGSGILLIDGSVEKLQFGNGQVIAFGDALTSLATDFSGKPNGTLHVVPLGTSSDVTITGGAGADVVLPDRQIEYYFNEGRGSAGEFILRFGGERIIIDQSVETVQFANGQYLALKDVPAYVSGTYTYTTGTAANDILYAALSGDQYLVGGGGTDLAEIHGNTGDYALREVHRPAAGTTPAIDGVELVALNRSGNLFIDQSTEAVQLQNGTTLRYADLAKAIAPVATTATIGHDLFFANTVGDQYFAGGASSDDLYVGGNTADYRLREVHLATSAGHPAIDGYELIAKNGSGDLYIDQSVETVHFQNGQYLSYGDLGYFIGS